MRSSSLAVAGMFVASLLSTPALAFSTGISGRSGKPAADGTATQNCTRCHAVGATVPTVEISGPRSVTAGSTNAYSFIIRGGPAVRGGMDLSVDKAEVTLGTVDSSLKLLSGELTHAAAKDFTNGELRFDFSVIAPASAGTFTLYGAGNSTNGDGSNRNDGVAVALAEVHVEAAGGPDAGTSMDAGTAPGPDAGSAMDAGTAPGPDAGTDAGTVTIPEIDAGTSPDPDHAGGGNTADTGGGCSSTGGAPLLVFVLSAAGLTLMRRRRA